MKLRDKLQFSVSYTDDKGQLILSEPERWEKTLEHYHTVCSAYGHKGVQMVAIIPMDVKIAAVAYQGTNDILEHEI